MISLCVIVHLILHFNLEIVDVMGTSNFPSSYPSRRHSFAVLSGSPLPTPFVFFFISKMLSICICFLPICAYVKPGSMQSHPHPCWMGLSFVGRDAVAIVARGITMP